MPRTTSSGAFSKAVGQEVRSARTKLGLTQAQVAGKLGVSPAYITNVEAGRLNLTIGQLAHIAAAMQVGLEVRLPTVERRAVQL